MIFFLKLTWWGLARMLIAPSGWPYADLRARDVGAITGGSWELKILHNQGAETCGRSVDSGMCQKRLSDQFESMDLTEDEFDRQWDIKAHATLTTSRVAIVSIQNIMMAAMAKREEVIISLTRIGMRKPMSVGAYNHRHKFNSQNAIGSSTTKDTAEALRMFSYFPSLRTIEIDCSEADAQKGLSLVNVAKKTLRACSMYRTPKCRSARVNKQADETRSRLAALYPEPMVVKVVYHPDIPTWREEYGHHDAAYFYPTRVEEYLV
ncbi:hypothetical protein BDV93DRAFT_515036 [Ceratobasidium sp. AG-I]|nr:hypothetical protein BDV93DRAFT_515036 [Ceratobasidium sp. AG-I]